MLYERLLFCIEWIRHTDHRLHSLSICRYVRAQYSARENKYSLTFHIHDFSQRLLYCIDIDVRRILDLFV